MKIIQTEKQRALNDLPTKLDVLRELNQREALDEDLTTELERLERRFKREEEVLNLLKTFGEEHWSVVKHPPADIYGSRRCDLLLITDTSIHPLIIKNYTGTFEFEGTECRLNGQRFKYHPILETQTMAMDLKEVLEDNKYSLNLQAALIFINKNSEVRPLHKIEYPYEYMGTIELMTSNQMRSYIKQIAEEEKNYKGAVINKARIIRQLEKVEAYCQSNDHEISDEIKKNVRTGIRCSHCGSFDIDINKTYISCSCGMYEPRENAIVRTICEYGVIHSDKDLRTSKVLDFFGGDISRGNLSFHLKEHFVKIGNGRGTKYINSKQPIQIVPNNFDFKKPRYLEIK